MTVSADVKYHCFHEVASLDC